jgi:hypothetical protein
MLPNGWINVSSTGPPGSMPMGAVGFVPPLGRACGACYEPAPVMGLQIEKEQ